MHVEPSSHRGDRAPRRGTMLRVLAVVAVVASATGCGVEGSAAEVDSVAAPSTLPWGELPDLPARGFDVPAPPTTRATATTLRPDDDLEGDIARVAAGNRVLVIGDSLVASTSPRYGGQMCAALNSYGWTVGVEAEVGRFIDFGADVLDARLPGTDGSDDDPGDPDRDWDVVVVFLGNNYSGDVDEFTDQLDALIERVAPRPVVLFTVTEIDSRRDELNAAIRLRARLYRDVVVIDWARITAADPSLVGGDGLHLTNAGRDRLALTTTATLGPAPEPGFLDPAPECVSPIFNDDSAIG